MAGLNRIVLRRLSAIIAGVACAAAVLLYLAIRAGRLGRVQLDNLARTEIQADDITRRFRGYIDDMHSTLLVLGREPEATTRDEINNLRSELDTWMRTRLGRAKAPEEVLMLNTLARELSDYFRQIDGVLCSARHQPTPADPRSGDHIR